MAHPRLAPMVRAAVLLSVLGSSSVLAAQEPFEVEASEPRDFTVFGLDLTGGWGHAVFELDLRWVVLTQSGFLLDMSAGGSWGFAEPGWGVHGDAIVGWAFQWESAVKDAITTAEAHAQLSTNLTTLRVDAYEYLSGVVPARGHFAILAGAKATMLRGVIDEPFTDDTTPRYLRIAAGFELGKVWGSWASRGGYRQFLWGYRAFRAMFLYAPDEGYRLNDGKKWSRFGAALQWIQTTRLGQSRTLFGATFGFEPSAGWVVHANLTWPFYAGSFR